MITGIRSPITNLTKLFHKSTFKISYPSKVKIFEVGPRDGLQNEFFILETSFKVDMINKLVSTGITNIEATSFVSHKAIPQFYDAENVIQSVKDIPDVNFSVLVPNIKGMEKAVKNNVKEIAIFTSVSDTFNKKNINCSIDESFVRFEPIMKIAQENNIRVRGYVSCIAGCPYQGYVKLTDIYHVTKRLLDIGVYEVSLGDTTGVGKPNQIAEILKYLIIDNKIDNNQLAVHFHNTNGYALQNIIVALQYGITTIDSSIAGIGGCPYARTDNGHSIGNVSTEAVVSLMNFLKIETGIDYRKLMKASSEIKNMISLNNIYHNI
jgi:hydroxymethylglutaryl-CoA lyase